MFTTTITVWVLFITVVSPNKLHSTTILDNIATEQECVLAKREIVNDKDITGKCFPVKKLVVVK